MISILTLIAVWCGDPMPRQTVAGLIPGNEMTISNIQACRTAMLTCLTVTTPALLSDLAAKNCAAAQILGN